MSKEEEARTLDEIDTSRVVFHEYKDDGEGTCEHCGLISLDAIHLQDEYEEVDHPRHYNSHPSGVECIDIIRFYPFPVGNAIKHLWRAGLKPGMSELKDLKKAVWYLNDYIAYLESHGGKAE